MTSFLERKFNDLYEVRPVTGSLGVEIEMEGFNYLPKPEELGNYWLRTMDGSLRGKDNAEYVLVGAMEKENVFKALDKLSKALAEKKSRIKDTVRAGVHVHINIQGERVIDVLNFVSCYYILEELLTERFCGEGRAGNHFCLRAVDADVLTYDVRRAIQQEDLVRLSTEYIRYAGCNLTSMFRHGSLEFRSLRTPVNLDRIKTWIEILLSIQRGSKMFRNPREIVEQFSMGGELNFLKHMLGEYSEALKPYDDELRRMLMNGARLVQEIGYSKKEW